MQVNLQKQPIYDVEIQAHGSELEIVMRALVAAREVLLAREREALKDLKPHFSPDALRIVETVGTKALAQIQNKDMQNLAGVNLSDTDLAHLKADIALARDFENEHGRNGIGSVEKDGTIRTFSAVAEIARQDCKILDQAMKAAEEAAQITHHP